MDFSILITNAQITVEKLFHCLKKHGYNKLCKFKSNLEHIHGWIWFSQPHQIFWKKGKTLVRGRLYHQFLNLQKGLMMATVDHRLI